MYGRSPIPTIGQNNMRSQLHGSSTGMPDSQRRTGEVGLVIPDTQGQFDNHNEKLYATKVAEIGIVEMLWEFSGEVNGGNAGLYRPIFTEANSYIIKSYPITQDLKIKS